MTTENNDVTVSETTEVTETVVKKARKPRSPNKPKTVDKLALLASRQVDRFNAQRDVAIVAAVDRVNERFDTRIAEFVAGLDDAVRPLVTGVYKPADAVAVEANEAEVAAE